MLRRQQQQQQQRPVIRKEASYLNNEEDDIFGGYTSGGYGGYGGYGSPSPASYSLGKQHKKPEERQLQSTCNLTNLQRIQILVSRVEIDFAPSNPRFFRSSDLVQIAVDLKNVQTLIVKVFEINIANYYKDNQVQVSTDIDLDGLVAHSEQVSLL